METLTAVLLILVAIAIVYEIARRIGVPYPTLLVLGGLELAFVPGLPRIELEPDPAEIAGYLGDDETFEHALTEFAVAYADQTEKDHQALLDAIASGRVLAS